MANAGSKISELIKVISEYLDEHYNEPLKLDEIGEKFGISTCYLAHMFKNETGVPPMKYIMYRKIGEAQKLLRKTNMSIREIGERLDFSSSCHLSTAFKKHVGMSPKTYRQIFRNNEPQEIENYMNKIAG